MKGLHAVVAAGLFAAAPGFLVAQAPIRAAALKVARPIRLADLDMDVLRGRPFRLGWAPDGSRLFVQTVEGTWADANTGRSAAKFHHYLFRATPGGIREDLDAPPDWFAAYWNAKSGQQAPDAPGLRIQLVTEQRKLTTTATPMGGDLAKGGVANPDGLVGDAAAAVYNAQWVPVHTMRYKGESVGEFVNSVIVPGLTYGWGPPGTNVLAYAALTTGRMTIIDDLGRKRGIPGTKNALLPAWSQDGTKLAWLRKDARKRYSLYVATVSGS